MAEFKKSKFQSSNFSKNVKAISWNKVFPILMSAGTALISIITTYFVAKPLGPVLYGELQYYLGVIQVLSLVSALGLSEFMVKNVQFSTDKKGFFSKWITLIAGWNIIILPVFFVIAFFALHTFNRNILLIMIVTVCAIFMCILNIVAAFFLGNFKQSKSMFFHNFLPKISLLLMSVILLYVCKFINEFTNYYMIGFFLIYGIISVAFLFKLYKKTELKFSKVEIISLISFFAISATYSLNSALAKIIGTEYYNQLDTVGAYALSVQIMGIGTLFSGTITSMSRPYFSLLSNDKEKLMNYFRKITRINAYIVIPFCIAFIVQSKKVLSIFGSGFIPFYWILIILSIGTLISDLTGPNGSMLAMAGYEKIELINGIVNIVIFLLCAFFFKNLGISGLALATLAAIIGTNIMKFIEILFIYKNNPYNFSLFLHFLILILISALVFSIIGLINNIYLAIAIDAIAGIILIIMFNLINPHKDDKYFFFEKH
ncbi:MAG: oligosaccharide flippase family protein [Bacteroidales bacterium]|nr:oligosaccharide flippase family protein [Bacteroidales bacterium]